MKKKFWFTAALFLILASSGFILQSKPKTKEKEAEEPKKQTVHNVELTEVATGEIHTYVTSTATLEAHRQVDIFSKLGGQIEEMNFEEGQKVAKGDVLVSLDGHDARLKLHQTQVALSKAKADFRRIAASYEKDLVSTEDYETRKFEHEKAMADYELAKYQSELNQVHAPFDGTIISRHVELGQTIQNNTQLFTLASLRPLKADVFLPEAKVSNLKAGMPVHMRVSAEEPFKGSIARISPVTDKETGTVKVTINIDHIPDHVRPGTYVNLDIVTGAQTSTRVIPRKALIFDSRQNAYVFKIKDVAEQAGQYVVTKTEVQLGVAEGEQVSILKGLSPGDQVVLVGKDTLKEGSLVKTGHEVAVH